jgi:hypothetical protein
MKKRFHIVIVSVIVLCNTAFGQTLSQQQMINARATGYAIVAAKNPGQSFSIYMIPWDGVNTLEYNANNQINPGWHAQAVIKGNYFYQSFDGSDFSTYSTVLCSQAEFDQYKSLGTQWWIVCSTLPPFSSSIFSDKNNAGNVGIGTTSPSEKLSVNGNIKAQKLIVTQNGWSDYVFDSSYQLKPLSQIELFIKANKHLPDVPSTKEVADKGIDVGENQTLLLKKIEELTLYIIDLEKRIKCLEEVKK